MELLSILLELQFLGVPLFDMDDFWKLVIKGTFNLFVITVIVRYIYYPITRNKDYLFSYLLILSNNFLHQIRKYI